MTHSYEVSGMSCTGCKASVEQALLGLDGIEKVTVDLAKSEATIEMTSHIPLKKLQDALLNSGLHYTISIPSEDGVKKEQPKTSKPKSKGSGTYYCPMHCEGEKTYPKAGDCPVCGMDLLPMYPEVNEEEDVVKELNRKMKLSILFAFPVFVISMSDMIPNNPLGKVMSHQSWNWAQFIFTLPVVFYTCWMWNS